jgi:VWFA-related protein
MPLKVKGSRIQNSAAIVALISLAALLLCAQQPKPLIRSTSRLVLLDVVVTDKTGHPIRSLNKEDFTVLENGAPQKITSFEARSPGSPTATPSTAVTGTSSPRGIAAPAIPPVANNSRTVILLDQLNTSFADLAYARDSILRFLDQDPADNQPIALMSVELRGLVVAQDYTQDRKRLKDKLLHLTPLNANSKGNMDINWAPEYAQAALSDLIQIARASVGAPYSVNVLWVTSGFAGMMASTNRNDELDAGMRRITNLLIRSRLRLYTIDPAGVVPKIPMGGIAAPNDVSRGSELQAKDNSSDRLAKSAGSEAAEADRLLSNMTSMMGGLSYYGRNDVVKALGQAVLDGRSAYVLSYSPSSEDFKGEYRKIEVHINVEGSTARTRPGYYAVVDEAAADQQLTEGRLQAAMSSTLTYSGVDLACPATFDPQKDRVTGKLVVTPKPTFATSDTHEQIIRISSFSKNGKPLNVWNWRVNWKDPWTSHVVSASFDKVLSPKATTVRFLISDSTGDRIGTCDYRLQ